MPAMATVNQVRFDGAHEEWRAASSGAGWEDEFSRLINEWRAVDWRSGGSTLMAALGLQFQEVPLCRGLAWLLDPDGGHQMGPHLLHALLDRLDLPVIEGVPISIRVEESRADTRADVVIRTGELTLVIEAKVLAGEQPLQADRLYQHWADENPTLLFLSRTGHAPYTAMNSAERWSTLAWRDLAGLARDVTSRACLNPSAGAREFIETIAAL